MGYETLTDLNPRWKNDTEIGFGSIDGPWNNSIHTQKEDLTLNYAYFSRSGEKIASSFVDLLVGTDEIMTADVWGYINGILQYKYRKRWDALYATMGFEYDPIENYKMTEEETVDDTVTRTPNLTHSETYEPGVKETTKTDGTVSSENTETATPGVIETTTTKFTPGTTTTDTLSDGKENTSEKLYGFNSGEAVNDRATETTRSSTNTQKTSGEDTTQVSDTKTGSDTTKATGKDTTDQSVTVTRSGSDETTVKESGKETTGRDSTRAMTRRGNIGVTTTQQMITQERELWKWVFFDTVFEDIDREIAIPIY